MEEWKQVKNHPNYNVSNLGRVYNIKTKKYLKGSNHIGYTRVKINNRGVLLHRLVAEHFIPNPENKPEVNHLNGKTDNRAVSLEWCTHQENCNHSNGYGKITKHRAIPILRIDNNGNVVRYERIVDVANDGFEPKNVHYCLYNLSHEHKGYTWKRESERTEEKIEGEEWVSLKDSIYEEISCFSKYYASNYGRIKGWFGRILVPNTSNIYNTIKLNTGQNTRCMKIHRVVLMAFNIFQPPGKTQVDHIDSNPRNNYLNNLRWASKEDQNKNSNSQLKLCKAMEKYHKMSKERIKILDEEWSWKTMTLWEFLCEGNYPRLWEKFFLREDIQALLYKISAEIVEESKDCEIYPPIHKVFRAFFKIDLSKIRVIVVGADPYHNPGSAVGICFSVPPGVPVNQSLKNIYKELKSEGYNPDETGSLLHWIDQGCLMINTALTVEKGNAGSHTHIWYSFTEKLLEYISENTKNVAWLLMGKDAAAFKGYCTKNGHQSFITSHPSPLSAYRPYQNYPAFLGSGIFDSVNNFLSEKKFKKILW